MVVGKRVGGLSCEGKKERIESEEKGFVNGVVCVGGEKIKTTTRGVDE